VTDFNYPNDLSKNNAGFSGAYNVPGRGSYWIWFKSTYFQKEGYGCKEQPRESALSCPDNGVESYRCVFFARMFFPSWTGVRHSFTWVYTVT